MIDRAMAVGLILCWVVGIPAMIVLNLHFADVEDSRPNSFMAGFLIAQLLFYGIPKTIKMIRTF